MLLDNLFLILVVLALYAFLWVLFFTDLLKYLRNLWKKLRLRKIT